MVPWLDRICYFLINNTIFVVYVQYVPKAYFLDVRALL